MFPQLRQSMAWLWHILIAGDAHGRKMAWLPVFTALLLASGAYAAGADPPLRIEFNRQPVGILLPLW